MLVYYKDILAYLHALRSDNEVEVGPVSREEGIVWVWNVSYNLLTKKF